MSISRRIDALEKRAEQREAEPIRHTIQDLNGWERYDHDLRFVGMSLEASERFAPALRRHVQDDMSEDEMDRWSQVHAIVARLHPLRFEEIEAWAVSAIDAMDENPGIDLSDLPSPPGPYPANVYAYAAEALLRFAHGNRSYMALEQIPWQYGCAAAAGAYEFTAALVLMRAVAREHGRPHNWNGGQWARYRYETGGWMPDQYAGIFRKIESGDPSNILKNPLYRWRHA